MSRSKSISSAYRLAHERYADLGVDVDRALKALAKIPVSLQCWQGDDVGGFENFGSVLGGGIAVTGNYPGKARTPDELRADLEKALSLIPGKHRLNLHAFYGEFGGKRVDRIAAICTRMFLHVTSKNYKPAAGHAENFAGFLLHEAIPNDLRASLMMDLSKHPSEAARAVLKDKRLAKLLLEKL